MTALTYADSVAAVAAWLNSRTATLVGNGNPLQKGAHFKYLEGAAGATYALLEEGASFHSQSAESPDMMAQLSAQVFGGTRQAATLAAVALAEELSTGLAGTPAAAPGALLLIADDIQGPTWAPVADFPRLIVGFTVWLRPA